MITRAEFEAMRAEVREFIEELLDRLRSGETITEADLVELSDNLTGPTGVLPDQPEGS